jgi:hypothetical protein
MTGAIYSPADVQSLGAGMLRSLGLDPRTYGMDPSISAAANTTKLAQIANRAQPATTGTTGTTAAASDATKQAPQAPVDVTTLNKAQLRSYYEAHPEAAGLDPGSVNDINRLKGQMFALQSMGKDTTNIKASINQSLDSAVDMQYQKNLKLQEGDVEQYNEYKKGVADRQDKYQNESNALDSMANIYSDVKSGRATEFKAALASWADQFGIPVDKKALANASDIDAAIKIASKSIVDDIGSTKLNRAPASGATLLAKTVAGPTMSPGAVYRLIGTAKGNLQYLYDRDQDFVQNAPRGISPDRYLAQYNQQNPDALKKNVASALTAYAGKVQGVPRETYDQIDRELGQSAPKFGGKDYGFRPAGLQQDQTQTSAPPPLPKAGDIVNGYQFTGGAASDKNNWKKVQ